MSKARVFPVIVGGQGRGAQRIKCARCGESSDVVVGGAAGSDDTVAAHFRRRGWEVDLRRQRHHCPTCIAIMTAERRESEARKRMTKATASSPAPSPGTAPGTVPPPAPSVESVLAKKLMSDALFEAYDLSARNYKPGWSDERVARESGLSVAFVAQRREADYGPAAAPAPSPLDAVAAGMGRLGPVLADIYDLSGALSARVSEVLALEAEVNSVLSSAESTRNGSVK